MRPGSLVFYLENMKNIMVKIGSCRAALISLGLCAALSAACKKSPPPPTATTPLRAGSDVVKPEVDAERQRLIDQHFASNPEQKKAFLREMEIDKLRDRQSEIDHKEMVLPTPANFRPSGVSRKILLTLKLEKHILRRGENPRFRLELQNIGREPIVFYDGGSSESSFFKSGSISEINRRMKFPLIRPDGNKVLLETPDGGSDLIMDEIKTPPGLNAAEKAAWIDNLTRQSDASDKLRVKLQPGETLVTRGDRPGDAYRTLRSDEDFEQPGTYHLQVLFDDRPSPLTQAEIDSGLRFRISTETARATQDMMARNALGSCSSNAVTFEVAP